MKWRAPILAAMVGMVLAGCRMPSGGTTLPSGSMGQTSTVEEGVILSVQEVTIEGNTNILATVGGAVVGYGVGNLFGGGRGRTLARAVGTAGGAAAGAAASKSASTQNALQIEVELDSGGAVTIIQQSDRIFRPGDEVKVLRNSDGTARVIQ